MEKSIKYQIGYSFSGKFINNIENIDTYAFVIGIRTGNNFIKINSIHKLNEQ